MTGMSTSMVRTHGLPPHGTILGTGIIHGHPILIQVGLGDGTGVGQAYIADGMTLGTGITPITDGTTRGITIIIIMDGTILTMPTIITTIRLITTTTHIMVPITTAAVPVAVIPKTSILITMMVDMQVIS